MEWFAGIACGIAWLAFYTWLHIKHPEAARQMEEANRRGLAAYREAKHRKRQQMLNAGGKGLGWLLKSMK